MSELEKFLLAFSHEFALRNETIIGGVHMTQATMGKKKKKKEYAPPEIKEVWNESIGIDIYYLLEM